ncbi:MAG: ATP-binding protein [Parvibaculum sp.]|uniref:sensor histidine kinase n=1 Tax=Parvibaculum sp. TaxID=2024848 RepID=UPI00284BEA29|nr:ATP-binding protein [Parvibaculum sp.]MDR3498486.1 ATP-binding protein [Parvibaculum sp.]
MTSGVYQRLERRLAALLTPDDKDEAVLRIELLRAVRRAHISSVFFMPVVAITCAVLDLNWVGISHIYIWLAAATLTPLLPRAVFLRMERAAPPPQDAGLWTLRCALASLPMQVAWPSMVAFAWIEGDPANNALMVSFLCAGLVLGATLSSASLPIALLGVAAYVPFLAIYRVEVDGGLWWTVPAAQIGFGVLIAFLAYSLHKVAADAVRQRLKNEQLVKRLADANSTADRARIRAEDANRAKSNFLASMSHDLRTPLNAVIGFSDLIRSGIHGPLAPARYAGYIEDIHSSGRHLLSLINDILDLAKVEAGAREFEDREVSLGFLVEEALNLVHPQAAKAEVELKADIVPQVDLRSDERALLQILANLLSNAVKFTRAGGTVTVFTRLNGDGGLMLGVEDTGIGIGAEDLARVMEPYAQVGVAITVEGRGTGLGLPIVKGLAEGLGGAFRIESMPGSGTRAWCEFPAASVVPVRAIA